MERGFSRYFSLLMQRLRHRYRIQVLDEQDFENKQTFRLSLLKLMVLLGGALMGMVLLTIYLVAFTPIREYIPGYADPQVRIELQNLLFQTDSLQKDLIQKEILLGNIQAVLAGAPLPTTIPNMPDSNLINYLPSYQRSKVDSTFRAQFEYDEKQAYSALAKQPRDFPSVLFFPPFKGTVVDSFDLEKGQYGIGLMASKNEVVSAVLPGLVVFSDWTMGGGYTIIVQHDHLLLSVYRNNGVLLKRVGDPVLAAEPIALVGGGVEVDNEPLYFQIWYGQTPLNPQSIIRF
jgi:murein DD-endopeptidase MepM/ murein hydrolase activator NlpD